jgi:hypothetical protein
MLEKFNDWLTKKIEHEKLTDIGRMAIFYLPTKKSKSLKSKIHNFLIKNYGAYTHEPSNIRGFWKQGKEIIKDRNERYEVSFSDKNKIPKLIDFLSEICGEMKEEAIYLTMGDQSYLVKP